MGKIDYMSPKTGRMLKEDDTAINIADYLADGSGKVNAGRATAIAGKVTVTTAATPVAPGNHPCGPGVTFIASTTNTGVIYVYPAAGAKTDVIPLSAGDSLFWPVANTSALLIDASVSGESVYWMGAV